MTLHVDRGRVRSLFASGVAAVSQQAGRLDDAGWEAAACGEWTAAETARHVLCVSRWYHSWLDRALAGDHSPPFDSASMDAENAAALAALGPLPATDAIELFNDSAHDYLGRVEANWDLPFTYPFGLVTAGLHAGIAATEWHLHAWDLSTVSGTRHAPDDPEGLFLAAAACVAASETRIRSAVMSFVVPHAARRAPWQAIVKRSGRGVT